MGTTSSPGRFSLALKVERAPPPPPHPTPPHLTSKAREKRPEDEVAVGSNPIMAYSGGGDSSRKWYLFQASGVKGEGFHCLKYVKE